MEKIFTDKISTRIFILIFGIGITSTLPMFFILQPKDYIYSIAVVAFVCVLTALLFFLQIKFQFLQTSLQFSFSPFVNNKRIDFEQIKEVQIENGSLLKYGGIGIRVVGNGTAYILGNEKNLVITLKNGKNIILSFKTQDEQEIILLLQKHNFKVK
jgi:hypothetical protein